MLEEESGGERLLLARCRSCVSRCIGVSNIASVGVFGSLLVLNLSSARYNQENSKTLSYVHTIMAQSHTHRRTSPVLKMGTV